MSEKAEVLFESDDHRCIGYKALVKGRGVQANQFVIRDHDQVILLDPGGDLLYAPLVIELRKSEKVREIDYVFASHQDPDVIASVDRWLMETRAKIVCSELWQRFLPHLLPGYLDGQMGINLQLRILAVPDQGMLLPLGQTYLQILPAHFLHSVGNLHLYDPVASILFSGDMGASLMEGSYASEITDFEQHTQNMRAFHERYMCSNKACKLWVNMVRTLDIEIIAPQHGKPFKGKKMVNRFLDWIENLPCGVDLLNQSHYHPPHY